MARELRFPDFLLIGAMKAGTTSLCNDLQANPRVFVPSVKEPHNLCRDEVLTDQGRQAYATLFRGATSDQLCGEGSTGYSKLPVSKGVPKRARQLLGEDLKLIYIVREPIARIVSHHYHSYRAGMAPADINQAVRSSSQYIDFTRYAMQLSAWMDEFPRDNVSIVRFEDYTADRVGTHSQLCEFLGVDPHPGSIDTNRVHNQGEDTRRPLELIRPFVRAIKGHRFFKPYIHPWMPARLRQALMSLSYRSGPKRPAGPTAETVSYILDLLKDDIENLRVMMGLSGPVWDFDVIRTRAESSVAGDSRVACTS